MSRQERHQQLLRCLSQDPLQTDQTLARQLGVSVPTIRLDRLTLGIPPLRGRSQQLAEQVAHASQSRDEINGLGELVALERGLKARATLSIDDEMGSGVGGMAPTYYLLAHAERLVYKVVSGDVVLTGLVYAKFYRPVRAGERLTSVASVIRRTRNRVVVLVEMTLQDAPVFRAKYAVYALEAGDSSR